MTTYKIGFGTSKNAGDAREWGVCEHYGIQRVKHDAVSYDKDSDVNAGEKKISVKASKFTLMSEGLTEFDDILNLYLSRVHSNTWVYVTKDGAAYEMNRAEFTEFVIAFCKTERESQKNGGATKIRCKAESAKMIEWLETRI